MGANEQAEKGQRSRVPPRRRRRHGSGSGTTRNVAEKSKSEGIHPGGRHCRQRRASDPGFPRGGDGVMALALRLVPKFPKEKMPPIVVEEGQPFILQCNPPKGIPPLQIYWMTISLQHIEQDERVSMGLNGDLYFAHAEEKDSRRDYCCFASFPRIRTIVQKTAMSVVVNTTNAILQRKPSLLTPTSGRSEKQLIKGEDLKLECIAEG
ncbi:hypothetical protein CRUP_034236, partial [Coryphaenoides rupestris]